MRRTAHRDQSARPALRRNAFRGMAAGLLCGAGWLVAVADNASYSSVGLPAGAGGAEIYAHICQGCHMPQGQGAEGAGHYPRLAGDKALVSWEYAALTVLNGRKGMPAFGVFPDPGLERFSAHLSDAQIAAVVTYVRSHFGNAYKGTVTADQVATLPHPGKAPSP